MHDEFARRVLDLDSAPTEEDEEYQLAEIKRVDSSQDLVWRSRDLNFIGKSRCVRVGLSPRAQHVEIDESG